jgi:hypothetical protein
LCGPLSNQALEQISNSLCSYGVSTVADYDNPEDMLRSSIWFALQQSRYQPPKTHDATARDAYYGKVADKVLEQIKLSGWLIEPPQTLQKKPPVQ